MAVPADGRWTTIDATGVSEALGAIPLAPRTARAIDVAVGARVEGPAFVGRNGERLDRHAA